MATPQWGLPSTRNPEGFQGAQTWSPTGERGVNVCAKASISANLRALKVHCARSNARLEEADAHEIQLCSPLQTARQSRNDCFTIGPACWERWPFHPPSSLPISRACDAGPATLRGLRRRFQALPATMPVCSAPQCWEAECRPRGHGARRVFLHPDGTGAPGAPMVRRRSMSRDGPAPVSGRSRPIGPWGVHAWDIQGFPAESGGACPPKRLAATSSRGVPPLQWPRLSKEQNEPIAVGA